MEPRELSIILIWGATLLYAIALIAYSVRLARIADAKAAGTEAPARDKAAGIARSTTLVGAGLHAAGVIARGIDAGHVPWSTMYEFTITGTLVAVLVFLFVQRWRDASFLGAGVTGMAALGLGLGLPMLYTDPTPLQPALKSAWLIIHVTLAISATGVLSVGACAATLQLLRQSREKSGTLTAGRRWRRLDALPPSSALEGLAFRLNSVGFVLWTFTVMAGAIWADRAWGRAWGWDPKEVWSFVVWIAYAAYLHARATHGWMGRRAGVLALIAFGALLANFTIVNLFFQGLHTYAKP